MRTVRTLFPQFSTFLRLFKYSSQFFGKTYKYTLTALCKNANISIANTEIYLDGCVSFEKFLSYAKIFFGNQEV